MKFVAVVSAMAAFGVGMQGAAASMTRRGGDSPDEVKLGMEYRSKDSFGSTVLTPACAKVDSTCCGYCWAPDHEVGVDRHRVVEHNATGLAVEQCDEAPSTCKGPGVNVVRCFKPSCRDG